MSIILFEGLGHWKLFWATWKLSTSSHLVIFFKSLDDFLWGFAFFLCPLYAVCFCNTIFFLFHHLYCIKRGTKLWQLPSVTLFRFGIITKIFESVLHSSSLRHNQKYRPIVTVEKVTLLIMGEVLGSKLGPETDCPDRNVSLSLFSSGPSHKCRAITSNQNRAAYSTRWMHWSFSNHLVVH